MEKIERYRQELFMTAFDLLHNAHSPMKMIKGMNRLVTQFNRIKKYEARAHALMRKGGPEV